MVPSVLLRTGWICSGLNTQLLSPQGIPPQEVATAGGDSYQQKGDFIENTSKENWGIVPNANVSRLTRTDPMGPSDQRVEVGETKSNCPHHQGTSQLVHGYRPASFGLKMDIL